MQASDTLQIAFRVGGKSQGSCFPIRKTSGVPTIFVFFTYWTVLKFVSKINLPFKYGSILFY